MNMEQSLGLGKSRLDTEAERSRLQLYINLKLSSTGQPAAHSGDDEFLSIAADLLASYREKNRLLMNYQCPIDQRIQAFLDSYLQECGDDGKVRLPCNSIVLDRYGVARELSLPSDGDVF